MPAITKSNSIEGYLKEGLLAIIPVYEQGDRAAVLTLAGRRQEARSVPWLVEKIATCYSLDLVALRRRSGLLLNLKHHISLPMNESLILLPVKVRQALVPGETTIGYVSMLQVEGVLPPVGEDSLWLSRVIFKSGLELDTLNTTDTLQLRLRQGEIIRSDFLKRRDQGACFTGLSRQTLIEQLPNCDCLLRDMFKEKFGLEPDQS